jgi:hypothetical protein
MVLTLPNFGIIGPINASNVSGTIPDLDGHFNLRAVEEVSKQARPADHAARATTPPPRLQQHSCAQLVLNIVQMPVELILQRAPSHNVDAPRSVDFISQQSYSTVAHPDENLRPCAWWQGLEDARNQPVNVAAGGKSSHSLHKPLAHHVAAPASLHAHGPKV